MILCRGNPLWLPLTKVALPPNPLPKGLLSEIFLSLALAKIKMCSRFLPPPNPLPLGGGTEPWHFSILWQK